MRKIMQLDLPFVALVQYSPCQCKVKLLRPQRFQFLPLLSLLKMLGFHYCFVQKAAPNLRSYLISALWRKNNQLRTNETLK